MKKKHLALFLLACTIFTSVTFTGCKKSAKATQNEYFEKGLNLMDKSDYKGAVKNFDKALELSSSVNKKEEDISTHKAAAQYLSGDKKAAIKTISNLIFYSKKNPDYYYIRGSFYADQNDFKKADKDYKKALELNKNDYKMCFSIYENLSSREYPNNAETYLDKVLSSDSNDGEIYYAKGQAYLYKGNTKDAMDAFDKAVGHNYPTGHLGKAKCYKLDGDKKTAASEIVKFEKNEKNSSEKYGKAAEALMEVGNYKEALSSVREGLKLNKITNEQELRKNEIICLEYLGQFNKAKTKAKSYVKDYPGDHTMLREWSILSTR